MLDLENERFTPSGGIDGRAARRAMGKPDMQFWELFLRETLQNSWDAKRADVNRIDFSIDAIMFTQEQAQTLHREVFDRVPLTLTDFKARLLTSRIHALVVSDSGTRGLGGVTRADSAAIPHESRDYVDFLRNVGRASNKKLGGGTYGFGKGVLYDASSVDTCIIYSQTIVESRIENRLVVSSVREQYESDGGRFTGRHWWGAAASDGVVDPLTGPQARAMADSLGLATMAIDATGTAICVLQPVRSENDDDDEIGGLQEIVERLSRAAAHWAWPHTVDTGAGPSITFRFSVYGTALDAQSPADDPIMKHYVRAYEKALEGMKHDSDTTTWPWSISIIRMLRPKQTLGVLAYRSYAPDEDVAGSDIGHHIALMRDPRFIVKYLAVSEDKVGQATAGVFIVDPKSNDDFAKSEPVAHDDWVPQGGRSNPVKVALDKIKSQFKAKVALGAIGVGSEHASGVALISRMLGSVLSGIEGTGVEVRIGREKSAGGASRRNPVAVRMNPNPTLVHFGGGLLADFHFKVQLQPGISSSGLSLDSTVKVVLDGGAVEDIGDMPNNGQFPKVFGWYADGVLVSENDAVPLDRMSGESLVLRVHQPQDLAITALISVRNDE